MKTVLVVDRDIANLSMISALFKPHRNVRVLGTDSVRRAATILKKVEVDLVLSELIMPDNDGIKLLAYVRKHYPDILLLVMSRQFTPALEARIRAYRPQAVFSKPFDPDRFMARSIELMGLKPGYTIQGISLSSYLQLVELEQKTCTLVLTKGDLTGTISCLNGQVIAAQSNGVQGKQSVYAMLFWEDAVIEVTESCDVVNRDIHLSITHLLIEGHCRKDEAEGALPDAHPANTGRGEVRGNEYGNGYLELTGQGEGPAAIGRKAATPSRSDGVAEKKSAVSAFTVKSGPSTLPLALSTAMNGEQGIDAYAVYDEHDNLKARSDGADHPLTAFTPSVYFEAVGKLNGMLGGGLKYINIQSRGKTHYAMFQCRRHVVVAAMRAHSRPADLIRTFEDALFD